MSLRTCSYPRPGVSGTDRCCWRSRKDYNEEWYPINDPTWHDKTGEPYGKVPTALDWISYDVRAAATANPSLLRLM